MKLSKTQVEALTIMASGFEAGYSWGLGPPRAWLQKGKVSYGGETKKLLLSTFKSLRTKELISEVRREGFRMVAFKINHAGKEALKAVKGDS